MLGRLLFLSPVLAIAALTGIPAQAKSVAVPIPAMPREGAPATPALRLAQDRQVQIVYDRYGRRLLVDPDTGEVVAVLPGRRIQRDEDAPRAFRRLWRNDDGDDDGYDERRADREERHYLDDQQDDRQPRQAERFSRRWGAGDDQGQADQDDSDSFRQTRPGVYEQLPESGNAERFPQVRRPPGAQTDRQRQQLVEREPLPDASANSTGQPSAAKPQPSVMPPAASNGLFLDGKAPAAAGDQGLGLLPSSAAIADLQVALDRAGASPGVIDGRFGDNVRKALDAYHEITGKTLDPHDPKAVQAALDATGGPAFTTYTITNQDAAGPYIASVPEDYSAKAKLDRLGYASVTEMLAERFHMDEDYLKALNPGLNFNRPGTVVKVANPGAPATATVARIVADKSKEEVFAYDGQGKLVAAYPSTIGSTDTPSPSGTVKVDRVAYDPVYTYNPDINFKQGKNDKVLTIPPGPNGPVGSVWIALSKPTYGIHGTPEPSKIGKTSSHGCVRLTNWDAQELAHMVSPGVWVQFIN